MDDSLSESLRRIEALKIGETTPSRDEESSDQLSDIVSDRSIPLPDRKRALDALSERWVGEPQFSELLLSLLNDPDDEITPEAIAAAPPFDASVILRLRQLLGDTRPVVWGSAALALARKKHHEILPLMADWSRRGDAARRRVGLSAVGFLLTPEPHLAFIESICEDGPRDDLDEAVLVQALRVAESRVAFWRKALDQQG